jgi:hypothetical protein
MRPKQCHNTCLRTRCHLEPIRKDISISEFSISNSQQGISNHQGRNLWATVRDKTSSLGVSHQFPHLDVGHSLLAVGYSVSICTSTLLGCPLARDWTRSRPVAALPCVAGLLVPTSSPGPAPREDQQSVAGSWHRTRRERRSVGWTRPAQNQAHVLPACR